MTATEPLTGEDLDAELARSVGEGTTTLDMLKVQYPWLGPLLRTPGTVEVSAEKLDRKQLAEVLFNLTYGGTCDPTLTEMAEAIAYAQADAIRAHLELPPHDD